ncbi:histidine--tRNA ligase [Porphyromonas levii]|uniref:histidine--tRNA ligase n=1 Tax=Porphyromonas levii TaxID=28114 RepID=UPI001B8D3907|nr:histidine--tRNA ligase [Porphyromonas levii]MBR8712646.1 Histidine--tRNA ligase [Porphyromonas levii]MBR8714740.1 Histidine--tRNA ligase [Porphyromonas levii]MBR8727224.1 Histidine--tRNA ligase [Porphyromonas levii]MBR8735363.1 Histidine--tRNA ligase [Porphyromonas levii]MBR8772932.1 Histidine--tRNA ligase [Porphyromonas levii]
MAQKPSIPKGTRDFSPEEMAKRNYIFDTIKSVYRTYGFMEIETPAMENLSTLTGKYGDEGDKLLFRILNSGDSLKDFKREELLTIDANEFAARACDRGLRYDLTVPFARYVVQHRNEITFPFRRFQIQPVWRADRPQKGRYREFFQCDADVIGSDSLLHEVELTRIIDTVFHKLGVSVTIHLNNRKLLTAIGETLGIENIIDLTVAIDKLDKIGWDGVQGELLSKGIAQEAIHRLYPILTFVGSNEEKLEKMGELFEGSVVGKKGIEELSYIFDMLRLSPLHNKVLLDLSLARGLDYYTGTIFEVKANDVQIGSITGGGRYDNLTGVFGLDGVSGVGISFGADRIFDVLNQLELYPKEATTGTRLMFVNFGDRETRYILPLLSEIREAGISAELYPEDAKLKKQMSYANALSIPYVAFVGAEEVDSKTITLKDMESGEQMALTLEQLIQRLL